MSNDLYLKVDNETDLIRELLFARIIDANLIPVWKLTDFNYQLFIIGEQKTESGTLSGFYALIRCEEIIEGQINRDIVINPTPQELQFTYAR